MTDAQEPDLPSTIFLIRQAKAGENEALDKLFARYYPRVRKIVRLRLGKNLLGVLDETDILQETFVAAIKAFKNFEVRNEASMINWLSRIAERKIRDAAKHHSARKRDHGHQVSMDPADSQDGVLQVPDQRSGPGSTISRREEAEIVEECIAELPEKYREIIVLRDYIEYGWEEVAREHGRPSIDAARMMHAKAMVELDRRMRGRMKRPRG